MSAAEQLEPLPEELPSRWRAMLEALPAKDRASLRWIGGEIQNGWKRLMEQPPSRELVREVTSGWTRAYVSLGAAAFRHLGGEFVANIANIASDFTNGSLPEALPLLGDIGAWICLCRSVSGYRWMLNSLKGKGFSIEKAISETSNNYPAMWESTEEIDNAISSEVGGILRAWILGQVLLENLLNGRGAPFRVVPLAYLAMEEVVSGGLALMKEQGTSEQFAVSYNHLGRKQNRENNLILPSRSLLWIWGGEWAAWWLVRRLRTEKDVRVLDEAASLLADMKGAAFWPILLELMNYASPEQAETLLAALELMQREENLLARLPDIAKRLRPLVLDAPLDVRLHAYRVLSVLPPDLTATLVDEALGREKNEEGIEALQDIKTTFVTRS